ncbi:hypothetical protein, partial [Streptomyces sp. SID486]|uniref:hypothetical protein n=1 Tax=Streptomyces sp. SID486 TaxID=2690264 RepID=UPI001F3A55BA
VRRCGRAPLRAVVRREHGLPARSTGTLIHPPACAAPARVRGGRADEHTTPPAARVYPTRSRFGQVRAYPVHP